MTTLYKKVGTRYRPVAEHEEWDSYPAGAHLVVCQPGSTLRRFSIDPDRAGLLKKKCDALRARIEAMVRQEPVAWTTKLALEHGASTLGFQVSGVNIWGEKGVPLYTLPGAQLAPSIKDAIIDDLQSQFDTEGITEHDSGDALIRLSDAIAAVEDNFAQPAPSIPEGWTLVPIEVIYLYSIMCAAFVPMTPQQKEIALQLELAKRAVLAVAPEDWP